MKTEEARERQRQRQRQRQRKRERLREKEQITNMASKKYFTSHAQGLMLLHFTYPYFGEIVGFLSLQMENVKLL